MTHKSELKLHGDYFVLHLSGEALPADKILDNMKKVIQLCHNNNIYKGIIHRSEEVKQTATILDFYELSEFLASQQLFGYKFALVFPEQADEDSIDFLKTASANKGINFKRFATYAGAEKWIQD